MSGFTKLVPEIVQSSIWNETPEVRCVWITLLAIKDKDGFVRGNPATLARIANVSGEAVREALDKFQAPDPDSTTPDQEGRRIQAMPGGWRILNHVRYRGRDFRDHERERKQQYRVKKLSGTCPGHVPDNSASDSTSASSSALQTLVKASRAIGRGPPRASDKKPYGEFSGVRLTDEEHAKLLEQHGEARLAAGIAILDDYMRSKGKCYRDHYAALKATSWVWKRVDELERPAHSKSPLINTWHDPNPDEQLRKAF